MPIPTWTFGELIRAEDVNNWFVPLAACKASDTTRTRTTTLTADPDLTLTVAANATYAVTAALLFTGPKGAGFFQWDFSVPTGATFEYVAVYNTTALGGLGAGTRRRGRPVGEHGGHVLASAAICQRDASGLIHAGVVRGGMGAAYL